MLIFANKFARLDKREYFCNDKIRKKMKKTIILLFLAMMTFTGANAQSLYKTVYEHASAIVNDPKSSDEQVEVNQFKVTALNYISNHLKKTNTEKDEYFYDSQAVNLSSFITDFYDNYLKARAISTEKRNADLNCYRQASLNHKLFNDPDKETVNCFMEEKSSLTPFCLDTDWNAAYEEATMNVKKIIR